MKRDKEYRNHDSEIVEWIKDQYDPFIKQDNWFRFTDDYGRTVPWSEVTKQISKKWPSSAGPLEDPWVRFIAQLHQETEITEPLKSDIKRQEEN